MYDRKITLAIEPAVSCGSIALLRGSELFAHIGGSGQVSRADDILVNIDRIMSSHSLDLRRIDRIAVSIGPGSFTGLRIGVATVLGLKKSFSIETFGISVLEAMARQSCEKGIIASAIPMGRLDICYQLFLSNEGGINPLGDPQAGSHKDLVKVFQRNAVNFLIVHDDILERFNKPFEGEDLQIPIQNAGSCLAELIGRDSLNSKLSPMLQPIYVRSPRFS